MITNADKTGENKTGNNLIRGCNPENILIFYQSDILRSDLNNVQLENAKKLFEMIRYIPVNSKMKLESDKPSLVIRLKFIKGNEDYTLIPLIRKIFVVCAVLKQKWPVRKPATLSVI